MWSRLEREYTIYGFAHLQTKLSSVKFVNHGGTHVVYLYLIIEYSIICEQYVIGN